MGRIREKRLQTASISCKAFERLQGAKHKLSDLHADLWQLSRKDMRAAEKCRFQSEINVILNGIISKFHKPDTIVNTAVYKKTKELMYAIEDGSFFIRIERGEDSSICKSN